MLRFCANSINATVQTEEKAFSDTAIQTEELLKQRADIIERGGEVDVEENVASSAKAEESCHDKTAIKNTAFKVSQEQVTRSSQTEAVACTNNQVSTGRVIYILLHIFCSIVLCHHQKTSPESDVCRYTPFISAGTNRGVCATAVYRKLQCHRQTVCGGECRSQRGSD